MSNYLALARKHRPQRFEDIVGQEHVSKTLQKAIGANRIHHAYLFAGIRGIGKTTCARVLAKALNCKDGPTPEPCNKCVSCKEITSGKAMDVMEIDAASNRGIDDIRELREGVRYTTARDRYKIVIIDEVHMLTEAAFNALLKTLEEPPAHVRFVLATTDPQKIPATILSRCQRFDFRRVTAAALVKHLQSICAKEEVEVEEGALAVIVRQTQGSVRDSMSLLDQLIAASEGKLTADWAKEVLGVADRRWVLDTLSALITGDPKKALLVLREVFTSGYDVNLFMTEVLQNLRNAVVLSIVGKNRELVDLTDAEIAELVALVKQSNSYDLHYCLQTMLASLEQVRKSEFPLIAAEEALVRVASAGQTVQIPKLIERLVELEQRITKSVNEPDLFRAPVPVPVPEPLPVPETEAVAEEPRPEPERTEDPTTPRLRRAGRGQGTEEPDDNEPRTAVSGRRRTKAAAKGQRTLLRQGYEGQAEDSEDPKPEPEAEPEAEAEAAASPQDARCETQDRREAGGGRPEESENPAPPDLESEPEPARDEAAPVKVDSGPYYAKATKGRQRTLLRQGYEGQAGDPTTPRLRRAGRGQGTEDSEQSEPEPPGRPGKAELAKLVRKPDELWKRFVLHIGGRPGVLSAAVDARVFEQCVLTRVGKTDAAVTVPLGGKTVLQSYDLDGLFSEFLGRKITVELEGSDQELLSDSIASDRKQKREKKRKDVERELLNHPHTRKASGLLWDKPKVLEVFEQDEEDDS